LSIKNPEVYESTLAITSYYLGRSYLTLCEYEKGEKNYIEALNIYRRLSDEHNLASLLYSLGGSYLFLHKYEESKKCYAEAKNIYRRLSIKNPDAYEPVLADALYNMGLLYSYQHNYVESEKKYIESLEIYRCLASKNPEVYKKELAGTLGSLSFYENFLMKYPQSQKYAEEGLSVDSTKHFIYTNLAASLLFQGKYEDAKAIYLKYKSELKQGFLDDFAEYGKQGVIPKERENDVARIKELLIK
jgi:tetratricopeptide (TPR) repeat protein